MKLLVQFVAVFVTLKVIDGRLLSRNSNDELYNEDDWEPVFRIYSGDDWNSHDDYLSQARTATDGDEDDSEFRSHKVDQWDDYKIRKIKVEAFDDGDKVIDFEFDGILQNSTGFFSPRALRRSNFDDIPDAPRNLMFRGDDFSFDGDDDSRHWAVSSRHVGDCLNDEGWFQVIDKPKPGRTRCVCGYENVEKYPTIMYAKNNRKTKWSDRRNVGYADMMQVSVSHKPYLAPTVAAPPQPVRTMQAPRFAVLQQGPPQTGGLWIET